ncbi:MAG: ABC transporter permease, partial [Corynebacterium casei]
MNLLGEFILDRWQDITFRAYQHTSLVLQSVLLALVIALIIGVLISSRHRATALANSLTSIGRTLPSLALLGLAVPLFGIG